MVKFKNFLSGLSQVRPMNGLPSGSQMDSLLKTANDGWGFGDGTGKIDGTNGFWNDAGTVKVGTMKVSDFLKLSDKAKFDFINSDAFSSAARTKLGKMDTDFSPDFAKSKEAGLPGRRAAALDLMDGNQVKPGKVSKFDGLMSKFSAKMALGGAAAIWTLSELIKLAEAQSGCFLVGPDGQEEKVSSGNCSCEGGEGNPNAYSCCEACNVGGDNFLCPGLVSSDDPPPPNYVCPSESAQQQPIPGRARKMVRATISAQAAKARDRAQVVASSSPRKSSPPQTPSGLLSGEDETCTSCGCVEGGAWNLCHRELGIFDVIGNMLAGIGQKIVEVAEDAFDIISDGIGELFGVFGDTVKIIIIVVSVAVGLAVVAGVTVGVVRLVKKRKRVGVS
jgi:hypothetical protein